METIEFSAPPPNPEIDLESKRMFVARLEQLQKDGHIYITIIAVLALLNDCDMLAQQR